MNPTFYPLFDQHDREARRLKCVFHDIFWIGGIASGLVAVVIFAYSMTFAGSAPAVWRGLWLPVLEVFFVFLSFLFLGRLAPRYKNKFLQKRNWAEYLRIHHLMESCGFDIKPDNRIHGKYSISEDIKALEEQYQLIERKALDLNFIKGQAASFVNEQNKYHKEVRIDGYKKTEHRIETGLTVILCLFGFIVLAKLVFELLEYFHNHFIEEHHWLLALCKFLIIILPPCYAALEGIFYFSEWKRNIKRSETVNNQYNTLLEKINDSQSVDELKELAKEINHIFWQEQYNWLLWYHNKKIEARV